MEDRSPTTDDIEARVEASIGVPPTGVRALDGGEVGSVVVVTFADRAPVVAKTGPTPLTVEAEMLRYLSRESPLPVPAVHHATDDLLVMDFVEGDGELDADAVRDVADHLAALHETTADDCGFPFDTLSGPYPQPNPWTDSWIEFFRDQRLLPMARAARDERTLPREPLERVEAVSDALGVLLAEPTRPSLVHGDVWRENVVVRDGAVRAFLDPACYYGHPEVELAYVWVFDAFGDRLTQTFFDRYDAVAGIEPGFLDQRAPTYALLPVLEHVRYFGRSYLSTLESTLARVECHL
jgi:fructosamine-3-kinase